MQFISKGEQAERIVGISSKNKREQRYEYGYFYEGYQLQRILNTKDIIYKVYQYQLQSVSFTKVINCRLNKGDRYKGIHYKGYKLHTYIGYQLQ